MKVDFYHLALSPLERVLPSICEKLLGNGVKLLIVGSEDRSRQLDERLWTYAPDSFLPHGRESAETQPILLSTEPVAANGATNIALIDGRWREEALSFERVFYFFDNAGREEARGAWRALKNNPEVEPRYWKQDEKGKWVQGP